MQYTRSAWRIWAPGAVLMLSAGICAFGADSAVTIYLQNTPPAGFTALPAATAMTTRIFSGIGVRLHWRVGKLRSTGDVAIAVEFDSSAAARPQPGVLALTRPFDESHRCVHVFYDRLLSTVPGSMVPELLGHVMAHEIAHILERSDAHSENGLMKGRWTASDYEDMAWRPMAFAAEDVERIREYWSRTQTTSTR